MLLEFISAINSVFFMLRVSSTGGAFPKPLPKDKEQQALELAAQGDIDARNLLIEHNMRLVAHIVKKG